jgi:hypothetical protein
VYPLTTSRQRRVESRVRSVVAVLLIALPTLAQAECGWLLMAPPGWTDDDLGKSLARPLIEWGQEQAYDTAIACEEGKQAKTGFWMKAADRIPQEKRDKLFFRLASYRCLPASQVPVR